MHIRIKSAIARNWKTTATSVFTAGCGFISLYPQFAGGEDSPIVAIAKFAQLGGLACLGIVAKDYNVTGGRRE